MTDKDMAVCVDRALCVAAWDGDTEAVVALLDAGADVHVWADAPLWEAAMRGHAETMKALLDAGADQDIALVVAAENGIVELVRELLARDAGFRTSRGLALLMAALALAAGNGHTDTVRALLGAGAGLHAGRDEAGRRAAESGHADTVRVLKKWKPSRKKKPRAGSRTA